MQKQNDDILMDINSYSDSPVMLVTSVKHDQYWAGKDPVRSHFPPAQKMAWRKNESNPLNLILARVLFRINPASTRGHAPVTSVASHL